MLVFLVAARVLVLAVSFPGLLPTIVIVSELVTIAIAVQEFVGVAHDDAESFRWSIVFFGIVKEITFLAKESAGAACLQLFATAFDVKANATASFSLLQLLNLPRVFEGSFPEKGFLLLPCKATLGAVGLGRCSTC
jgi:hypothetical protein